jgi:hypothetical protein
MAKSAVMSAPVCERLLGVAAPSLAHTGEVVMT